MQILDSSSYKLVTDSDPKICKPNLTNVFLCQSLATTFICKHRHQRVWVERRVRISGSSHPKVYSLFHEYNAKKNVMCSQWFPYNVFDSLCVSQTKKKQKHENGNVMILWWVKYIISKAYICYSFKMKYISHYSCMMSQSEAADIIQKRLSSSKPKQIIAQSVCQPNQQTNWFRSKPKKQTVGTKTLLLK